MEDEWRFTEEEFNIHGLPWVEKTLIPLDENFKMPMTKPDWFNPELFRSGQEFAAEFPLSTAIGQTIGLMSLLAFENSVQPLIYTRKSDKISTANKRYMSTALIVKSWMESDLFDEKSDGHKNIKKVINYHQNVSKKVNSLTKDEIENKCTLNKLLSPNEIKCPLISILKKDVLFLKCPKLKYEHSSYFNQAEMSLTLFGFMGYLVAFPDKFGIPEDEPRLEGFVHMWRTIGFLLGVQDEHNLCSGDYLEVRQKCRILTKLFFRPNFQNINSEWEHMTRCAVDGVRKEMNVPPYESLLLYLFWVIGIKADNLLEKISWTCRLKFYLFKYLVTFVYTFKIFRATINFGINQEISKYQKKFLTS